MFIFKNKKIKQDSSLKMRSPEVRIWTMAEKSEVEMIQLHEDAF